jgi:non-heme chloroperoxidase
VAISSNSRTDTSTERLLMPYFQANDGTSLFYRDWGTGLPVLFVSSAGLSSDMWQYQMVGLNEAGLRCVAYDRRGHGRSDDPGRGFDADTLADDLASLLHHLDLRAVVLVGHSMGSAEVIRYLTRHGDSRVSRIALVAASLPFLLKTEDNPDGVEAAAAEAVRAGWRTDLPQWVTDNAAAFFGEGLPGCETSILLQEWLLRDLLSTSLQAAIECNRNVVFGTDYRAEMRTVAVPTLIIHGDKDASCPLEITGAKAAELVPNNRLVVYENAPHGLFLTHVDQLNEDLVTFVKS